MRRGYVSCAFGPTSQTQTFLFSYRNIYCRLYSDSRVANLLIQCSSVLAVVLTDEVPPSCHFTIYTEREREERYQQAHRSSPSDTPGSPPSSILIGILESVGCVWDMVSHQRVCSHPATWPWCKYCNIRLRVWIAHISGRCKGMYVHTSRDER